MRYTEAIQRIWREREAKGIAESALDLLRKENARRAAEPIRKLVPLKGGYGPEPQREPRWFC